MLSLNSEDVQKGVKELNNLYAKGVVAPLMFEDYIRKTLTKEYNDAVMSGKLKFPKEIRIAKGIDELSDGDTEPERVVVLKEVLRYKDIPIWWGDPIEDGITLGCGFVNGDSRKLSNLKLDDTTIHAFLGGVTGFGKSVTLNDMIFTMLLKYAPWSLNMVLLDAKGADIKRFSKYKIPHVKSIGATTDTDYIISVLDEQKSLMKRYNGAYGNITGSTNFKDFCKETGLTVPATVIVCDELATLLKDAGKKEDKLKSILDEFARLGRNTRFHLVCSSQELDGTLDTKTMNQFHIRACLGATKEVSTTILGNSKSGDIKVKGIMNAHSMGKEGTVDDNIRFKVPFQPNYQFKEQAEFTQNLGEYMGMITDTANYDETVILRESKFAELIDKYPNSDDIIYLGEPCYVTHDEIPLVKIDFTGESYENIAIIHPNPLVIRRMLTILYHNIKRSSATNVVLYANRTVSKGIDLESISKYYEHMETDNNIYFKFMLDTVIYRSIMFTADNNIRKNKEFDDVSDSMLRDVMGEEFCTDLNRSRAYYCLAGIKVTYSKELNMPDTNAENISKAMRKHLKAIMNLYINYNCFDRLIEQKDFPLIYVWMLEYNEIRGLGIIPTRGLPERFRNILFLSCKVNIRFIITATNVEEFGDVIKACRSVLMEGKEHKFIMKIGNSASDIYPDNVPMQTACLVQASVGKVLRFKKMYFDDEIM